MNIIIAGATGFIGRSLIPNLLEKHQVIALGRDLSHLKKIFPNPRIKKIDWHSLHQFNPTSIDLIINLAGTNIAAQRWTSKIKAELISSRVQSNHKLIEWITKHNAKPRYFSASAVGIYGAYSGNKSIIFDEDDVIEANDNDFLKEIGLQWENSLRAARNQGIHTTSLRFGVVLKKHEGMLKKLELHFQLGLGCVLGSGDQVISWIHHEDLTRAILFLIDHPDINGNINITSPQPISQKIFAQKLAKQLKRPLFLKMPEFVVQLLFGEMGNHLLLKGQIVMPKRLTQLGFEFIYPEIGRAFEKEYSN